MVNRCKIHVLIYPFCPYFAVNTGLLNGGNRNSIIMSSNDNTFDGRQQHHHQSPEFAGNYTFGEQSVMANHPLHNNHFEINTASLHPVPVAGHQEIHAEGLFNSVPTTTENVNLHSIQHNSHLGGNNLMVNNNHQSHQSHHHNHHHPQNMHHETTDLNGFSNKLLNVGPGVVGPPQYTSVIVEPPQTYQLANEYVH